MGARFIHASEGRRGAGKLHAHCKEAPWELSGSWE